MRVLVVCLGNICRSPAGEAALRRAAPDWSVDSAGLGDWHAGDPPYGPMQKAGRALGYDISGQRARPIAAPDFDRFNLILAMDQSVMDRLVSLCPEGAQAALQLFDRTDVPDPYYTRDFAGAWAQIIAAAGIIVRDRTALPSG